MAFGELRELQKGHERLAAQTQARGLAYQGKRHATRLMSDAYCKGVVRGQAESTSLRAFFQQNDAACAEESAPHCSLNFPAKSTCVIQRLP